MKIVLALLLSAIALYLPSSASGAIVNLGHDLGFQYDTGGSDPAPVSGEHINFIGPVSTLSLSAGTYDITNATGLSGANPNYTAWSYNLGTSSWTWGFVVATADGIVIDYQNAGSGDSQAEVASLPGVIDFHSTFTLSAPTDVAFTLRDYYVEDNGGGISLDVQPAISSGIPESSTWVMMLIGFGTFGIIAIRKKASETSLSKFA